MAEQQTSVHDQPEISVVIPIYNEENLLETAVFALVERITMFEQPFEIILSENGSTDRTAEIADSIAMRIDMVTTIHDDEADYGRALRSGILSATGKYVICDEIDLGDMDFYRRALEQLDAGADIVIGSKRHPHSADNRPWLRRQGTMAINNLLHWTVGFSGTDTHGLKAFRRSEMIPIIHACELERDLFASEMVIRAERRGLKLVELPLELREIRPPSIGLFRRIPRVLRDLSTMVYIFRIKDR